MPLDADRELEIIKIASRQGGVIAWRQLQALGVRTEGLQTRMRRGALRRIARGVYELPGPIEDEWLRRARGACLAIGRHCVLSHASAGRLYGLELAFADKIEVTVLCTYRPGRSGGAVVVHRTGHLVTRDRDRRSGLPVTSCARTFLDLAARYDYKELCGALDNAIGRRVLHPQALASMLRDPRNRGRPGSGSLRRALVPWLQTSRPGSVPEADLVRFILEAGVPAPVLQHKVFDRAGDLVAILDLAWVDEKVAVEMDGFRYHSSPDAHSHDRDRDNGLGELGWIVIRITPTGLAKSSRAFLNNLRSRLAERGARL